MAVNFKIEALNIFLERRKTRILVGRLEKKQDQFIFTYDERYLRASNVIPLGPEFPLIKREFISKFLFPSMEDRIPSRDNPAYPEYCYAMGIDLHEDNPLILLTTIGKRGPSSFIFIPVYERTFGIEDAIEFRKSLRLTSREFAHIFEISQSSLNALERKRHGGKDLLKRLEMIIRFPEVALFLFRMNGGVLQHSKWEFAKSVLTTIAEKMNNFG